jgi:uncharacterized protein (DUF934 family)
MTYAIKVTRHDEGDTGWMGFYRMVGNKLVLESPVPFHRRILFDDYAIAKAFARRMKRVRPDFSVRLVKVP